MTNNNIIPTNIKLHKKSRLLEIHFSNGEALTLSCEYLRTHAKSAEIRASAFPVAGKIDVNIDKIEPQGTYALRFIFDDGYESGIFSWDTLLDLGHNYKKNWQHYLELLEQHHLTRSEKNKNNNTRRVTLLFFMDKILAFTKTQEESLVLPDKVKTVSDLLYFLRQRGKKWEKEFSEKEMQVTVNKEFSELFTILDNDDEIAFIPRNK